jgi:hypothetical protein
METLTNELPQLNFLKILRNKPFVKENALHRKKNGVAF